MEYQNITEGEFLAYTLNVGLTGKRFVQHLYLQNILDYALKGILSAGKANNKEEAISYIAKFVENLPKNGKINWGDIAKTSANSKHLKKLETLATGEEKKSLIADLTRTYGVYGHTAIPALLSGHLRTLYESTDTEGQTALFLNEVIAGKTRKSSWRKVAARIIKNWYKLGEQLEKNPLLFFIKGYDQMRYKKMRFDLSQIFDGYLPKVEEYSFLKDTRCDYLSFLTFMTWAGAVADYDLCFRESGDLIIFSEIPVLPYVADMSAGRIDALELFKINGARPTASQQVILRKMAGDKFLSVGHLILELVKIFGENLEIRILDWKFAVGDGPSGIKNRFTIIQEKEVESEPLVEHKRQMERYISTARLSYFLAKGGKAEDIKNIWQKDGLSIRAMLIYFLPTSLMKTHEISLTEEGAEKAFREQIAADYSNAEYRAFLRKATNTLAKNIVDEIEGKQPKKEKQLTRPTNQLTLSEFFTDTTPKESIKVAQVVDHYRIRVFADDYKIVEVFTNKKGEKRYEMHLDQLEKAVEEGLVKKGRTGGWNGTKGTIHCIMPDHEGEKTASLNIVPKRGFWKCFGCGAGGHFAKTSLPEYLQLIAQNTNQREDSATMKLVIPPRHQEIMKKAQELLQKAFPGSPGERYLAKERGLNPEISYRLGAGYADINLIFGLFDAGFNYQELLHFGFLGTSPNVQSDNYFVRKLLERGFKLEEITKYEHEPQKGKVELKKIPVLPYFVLGGPGGRVTYPLEIDGIINSFYGRLTNNSGLKHSKLEISRNNMPHGAFNMTNAMAQGSEILVVEAPINADTVMQSGGDIGEAVTAIIGVNNPVLYEALARYEGNINIGMDYDKDNINEKGRQTGMTGQRSTVKLTEFLQSKSFKGEIRNFTEMFVAKNPEFTVEVNDFNEYWKRFRKPISVLQTINT